MSGLLTGILLARTVSGLIAGAAGWRAPFILAAVLMAVLAAVLWRALPRVPPPSSLPYGRLLLSVATLVRDEPVLRRRIVYGVCGFAGFTLVWTTIAFLLADPPVPIWRGHDRPVRSRRAGRCARRPTARDDGRPRPRAASSPALMLATILASWGVLALGSSSVIPIVLGLVLVDFGVQGQNVLSQHVIYGLGGENASRVTTAYVTSNFLGGAVGSADRRLRLDRRWLVGGVRRRRRDRRGGVRVLAHRARGGSPSR